MVSQFTRACKLSCLTVDLSMAIAIKMCHLLSAACQDVLSFILGRWPVITLPLSLLGVTLLLSRCFIFGQQPVKMYHLRQVVSFFFMAQLYFIHYLSIYKGLQA